MDSEMNGLKSEERRRVWKQEGAMHVSSLQVSQSPPWNVRMSVEELESNERQLVWQRSLVAEKSCKVICCRTEDYMSIIMDDKQIEPVVIDESDAQHRGRRHSDYVWHEHLYRILLQPSVCPTIGGHNPGVHTELVHTVREQLNLICGFAYNLHPSAYASLSIGRSKWSGNVGNTGMVIRVESPLSNMGRPYFSVQLNSGFEL